jgi:metal-responsive CopG/Arc/MetJ family transcriptional regulator
METKQVNIAVPMKLFSKIENYVEENGYRNAQDLFLDLARKKVIFETEDLEIRDEVVNELLNLKKEDFIGEEESKKILLNLGKEALKYKNE